MEIQCIDRNGVIDGYNVKLLEQGMVIRNMNVTDRMFMATGLSPFTNYTFQIAGMTSIGVGPFLPVPFTTAEAGKP
jgi:hypothetical protein